MYRTNVIKKSIIMVNVRQQCGTMTNEKLVGSDKYEHNSCPYVNECLCTSAE
jgi:hypothetical protein